MDPPGVPLVEISGTGDTLRTWALDVRLPGNFDDMRPSISEALNKKGFKVALFTGDAPKLLVILNNPTKSANCRRAL
jgi:hypothetical protein